MDGDGDPDLIIIKLEVAELNGHSPDFAGLVPTFDMAPGIQPGMWVFAPKSRVWQRIVLLARMRIRYSGRLRLRFESNRAIRSGYN